MFSSMSKDEQKISILFLKSTILYYFNCKLFHVYIPESSVVFYTKQNNYSSRQIFVRIIQILRRTIRYTNITSTGLGQ